jgi:hypothetical protein
MFKNEKILKFTYNTQSIGLTTNTHATNKFLNKNNIFFQKKLLLTNFFVLAVSNQTKNWKHSKPTIQIEE